jgi:hypothetical protein
MVRQIDNESRRNLIIIGISGSFGILIFIFGLYEAVKQGIIDLAQIKTAAVIAGVAVVITTTVWRTIQYLEVGRVSVELKKTRERQSEDYEMREMVSERVRPITDAELINLLSTTFSDYAPKVAQLAEITEQFANMKLRLTQEIKDLSRRANVNLVLGMLMSIGGMLLMGFFVYQISGNMGQREIAEVIVMQTTRLSLVILIEVFAYFFSVCIVTVYLKSNTSKTKSHRRILKYCRC